MSKEENKKQVYTAITKAWEFYKKCSQQEPLDEEASVKEATEIAYSSPVLKLQQDLLFAVMDQIGRERNVTD